MTDSADTLASLLRPDHAGHEGDSADDVDAWVAERLSTRGCARPEPGADDDADPRHAYWWLLRMAARTHRQGLQARGPIDPMLTTHFERLLADRPARDDEHAQLHIDAESTLRRAAVVHAFLAQHPGPVLAVGDDDAVTLALDLLGAPELHAVDIDPHVLEFLSTASRGRIRCAPVDVLQEAVPRELRQRCAAVIADPIRSLEPTLGFLLFGAAAMRRDAPARLFYCDHPDWTFEHPLVLETLGKAGLRPVEVHEDLHAYPLDPQLFEIERIAAAVGEDPAWLRKVAVRTRGYSHLYVLER